MEKKEQTLTLTLPFVDFKGTDKESDVASSYKTNGMYFVRNRHGLHEIASVNIKKDDVWVCPLPPTLGEVFFMQNVEQEQADKFEEMNERIDRMHSELIAALLDKSETIKGSIKSVKELMQMNYDRLGKVSLDVEELSIDKPSDSDKPKGGYVDQETLLQLIKEVKK